MRFYIDTLTLWLKNNEKRTLKFLPNKVNVITGASGTGKTEILSIIEYCLFSSNAAISEEKINENVEWYGLTFKINDKLFTIARQKITKRKGSPNYYFSSQGKIPDEPFSNMQEPQLKEIIQNEFSINSKVVIPFSGRNLKAGNKISFKYFMLFNTQSANTISNNEVYFDKQSITRYKEALDRIFDIALKVEEVENIIKKEKIKSIEKEITKFKNKQLIQDTEVNSFESEITSDVKQARLLGLIDDNYIDPSKSLQILRGIVNETNIKEVSSAFSEIDELNKKRNGLILKIRNFQRLQNQYKTYLNVEKNNYDSLKPIQYIKENFSELLLFPETEFLLQDLEFEFLKVKKEIENKTPFNINIEDELNKLEENLSELDRKIEQIPSRENFLSVESQAAKLLFLGELNYKLSLYENKASKIDFTNDIMLKENQLEELNSLVRDEKIDREAFKSMLESLIQNYLDKAGAALGNYQGFKALFDFKEKFLHLRQANSIHASHVGSSSNHLFMHLCLFLGLHEASIIQKSPYIPQFMILDQPSRPYYGEEEDDWSTVDVSDKGKITSAMKLLNDFISHVNNDYEEEFQFILLEHIPETVWEGMENFHLVEEFRYGNALIREN